MLDLGSDMVFKTKLKSKSLVDCAFHSNSFTVDDASDYQIFCESTSILRLSNARRAELVLNCVAARRFYKPVQPKSWFFNSQSDSIRIPPSQGEIICLANDLGRGHFIILESGQVSSLCLCIEPKGFSLSESKTLWFSDVIKVMHDRIGSPKLSLNNKVLSMVG